jgi:outer membrane biosynthesis protein TonB
MLPARGRADGDRIKPRMRMSFVISVVGHAAALLVALIFAGANPFDSVSADAITVDIVTPNDLAEAANETEKPDDPFDLFSLSTKDGTSASASTSQPEQPNKAAARQPAQQSQQSRQSAQQSQQSVQQSQQSGQQQSAQQPSQQKPAAQASGQAPQRTVRQALAAPAQPSFAPEPEAAPAPLPAAREPSSFADVFAMPITLPDGRVGGVFDAAAYDAAKIEIADRNAFRDHLKTCSKLPGTLSPSDHIRVVLRVAFKPNGTLASSPTLIEASASTRGPALMESAIRALRQCQPYTMLPSDKYDEWKVIDVTFTPDDFQGG